MYLKLSGYSGKTVLSLFEKLKGRLEERHQRKVCPVRAKNDHFRKRAAGVLAMVQQDWRHLGNARMWVRSQPSTADYRSSAGKASAWVANCGSDLIPGPGNSIRCRAAKKENKSESS